MSDWVTDTEMLPPQRPRGFSPGAIAAVATVLVVLAVVGAVVGWRIADAQLSGAGVATSPSPSVTVASPAESPTPSPSPEPSPEPSPTPVGRLMPDLTGSDFQQAFAQLRGMGYQVNVRFNTSGAEAGLVVQTEPQPNVPLRRGATIKLLVAGPPPAFDMPDVRGLSCTQGTVNAKDQLLDAGLLIKAYVNGQKTGAVSATNPEPGTRVQWNQQVTLDCTEPSPDQSP